MRQLRAMIVKRLMPGQDLKLSILDLCNGESFSGGCVICAVGSLSRVRLRLPLKNGSLVQRLWEGPCEIVSLTGTISEKGEGVHLHLSFADSSGRVRGGHVLEGCVVHTTVELVIVRFDSQRLIRTVDPGTGFEELSIEELS